MRGTWQWIRQNFPMVVVVGTFVWSAVAIAVYREREEPSGVRITLRIGHWQLESGVRDGFEALAEEYRKEHPGVHVIQDAIPEGLYGQWLSTQLMGGTAPDIIELGKVPQPILLSYYNRYFLPLTSYVNQPNPYNRGTEFDGVPLRRTYKDGMRGAYVEELQEYMGVPLSQFVVRIFYNKNLLKKLTGLDEPPQEYRAFLAMCDEIAKIKDERGQFYIPIVGSKYHLAVWDTLLFDSISYSAIRLLDFNNDGSVGSDECFVGFQSGRINFQYPAYEAKFQMVQDITSRFQPGYTGLGRDEGVFLFAQQRAVFTSTGTWDAFSLQEQAKGDFEVGVMDSPVPDKNDPVFGPIIEGPRYEKMEGDFKFGITRTSKHPEVALDFLQFCASKKYNEELNRIIGWIPSVRNTKLPLFLEGFTPHLEGVQTSFNVNLGGETFIKWEQLYALFLVHQISYEELAARFGAFYRERGIKDFEEAMRNRVRARFSDEQLLAGFRARTMGPASPETLSAGVKYRRFTQSRLIDTELNDARLLQILRDDPTAATKGPYEYSPQAMERIRAQLP